MGAPSKSWTDIADGRIDADSPVVEKLLVDIRDDLVYLREWLGGSYAAEVGHNHDGLNSAPVGNSEWQAFNLSEHFFLDSKGDMFKARWRGYVNDSTSPDPSGAVVPATQDVLYLGFNTGVMSSLKVPLKVRSLRVAMRIAFPAWASASGFKVGLEDNVFATIPRHFTVMERGTNSDTVKLHSGENAQQGGAETTTDNLSGITFGGSAWNDVVIENWIDTDLAPDGQKETILYLNGTRVASHRADLSQGVPGANISVSARVVLVGTCWLDYVRVTSPPTKALNVFPLPTS